MIFHNSNSLTHVTHSPDVKYSNLDLILSTIALADKIDVKVESETWGYDHFSIYVDINQEKTIYRKKSLNIKSVRTNWEAVNEDLENHFSDYLSSDFLLAKPSEQYNILIEIVTNAIITNSPKKKCQR